MNKEFYKKVDEMFENNLNYEEVPIIRIKDLKENKILENINYKLVVFDSNLNMYKLQENGCLTLVDNPNFKPMVVYKKIFLNIPLV